MIKYQMLSWHENVGRKARVERKREGEKRRGKRKREEKRGRKTRCSHLSPCVARPRLFVNDAQKTREYNTPFCAAVYMYCDYKNVYLNERGFCAPPL